MFKRVQIGFRDDGGPVPGGLRKARILGTDQPVLVATAPLGPDGVVARSRVRNEQSLLEWMLRQGEGQGLPQPLGTVEDEQGLMLLLPDPGGQPLSWADPHPDLPSFLQVAVGLAAALSLAHRTGVVHGGIDPDEVVVHTGERGLGVTLFGWGDAARMGGDSLPPVRLDDPDVRLAYISPEQTGRMNRSIDHRTDLYSLGVVLYEFLTGTLPFEASDAMGWVHAHIAQRPEPARAWRVDVPAQLSRILDRLLSKNAGDRYQSAAGLLVDLEECLRQVKAQGMIEEFPLGRQDQSLRFRVPDRLYGRETELQALFERFEDALDGGRGLVLVTGRSGIGKSRLIWELHRPVVTHRAWFVAGKSDQYRRGQPYLALIRALGELVRQILTESQDKVEDWRGLLQEAVGPNGQVVIDVIPELELVIGPQSPLPPLASAETVQRFQHTFIRFVQAIATGGRTLVLFLDDLQWADSPSLSLLETLLGASATRNLLVIGAYRDGEVGEDHPLQRMVASVEQAGVPLVRMALGPLSADHTAELVADALGARRGDIEGLAAIVSSKTAGNPFFVAQFLKRLHQERVIGIDPRSGVWTWDKGALASSATTDNVVELMAERITSLPDGTRRALVHAALLGARFELSVVADLLEAPVDEVGAALRVAVDEGLVLPEGDALRVIQAGAIDRLAWFRFLHDRVQEAAYEQVPAAQRPALHLEIGRRLLRRIPVDQQDERLFDVVAHISRGLSLVVEARERRELAHLHLRAAVKAMATVAHDLGRDCFERGIELAGEGAWQDDYALALDLAVGAAEACYLTGQGERSRLHAESVLTHARDVLDRIRVYDLRIHFAHNELRFPDALREGREALELLGYPLADPSDPARFPEMVGAILGALGDRQVPDLAAMDEIDDPRAEAAIRISSMLVPTCAISRPDLLPPLIFTAVHAFLVHGMTPAAAVASTVYGMLLAAQGQYAQATAFARLALEIRGRYPNSPLPNPILVQAPFFVLHWTEPLRDCVAVARTGISRCPELGDIVNAGYAGTGWLGLCLVAGNDLAWLDREFGPLDQSMRENRQMVSAMASAPWGQAVACLRGDAADPAVLSGSRCDPTQLVPVMEQFNFGTGLFYVWVNQAMLALVFGRPDEAIVHARKALAVELSVIASVALVWNRYLLALALLQLAQQRRGEERQALRDEALGIIDPPEAPQLGFARLAEVNPPTFRHRQLLVQAELARLEARDLDALRLFEEAADAARAGGFSHDAALALERAALYHREAGRIRLARAYAVEAVDAWSEWGALAKVAHAQQLLGDLLPKAGPAAPAVAPRAGGPASSLDLATVTKASEAIAGELLLDRLLDRLMRILLENAGARRALLLLPRDVGLRVVAEGRLDSDQVEILDRPLSEVDTVASGVVNYVARTRESVVLGDSRTTQRFAGDVWLHRSGVRSLLCAPLINQGELSAIVYLENDLAADAFTPDRVELLRVLAGQAAIAIDHARLYHELRQQTEELERKNVELTELDRLRDQFLANTSHELRTPLNGIIGIAESLLEGVTGELPRPTQENLGLVVSSARRLSNLVNDLLDFSTLQHRKIELALKPVDLHTMVRAVLSMSTWLVGDRPLELHNEIPAGLPAALADEERLEQILTNLVGNAVKFTEQGSVRVRAHRVGDLLRVEVVDTGIGIRQEVQERIFESFEQADGSTSRLFGGTGLGLAVARELVHLHGGEIGVDSQPGQGATFWFTLGTTPDAVLGAERSSTSLTRLRPEPVRRAASPAPVSVPPGEAGAHELPRVLVVDDDATNLQVLVNQLTVRGFQVESAVSGMQALQIIEGGYRPDLALLDVMMPTLTGYDVTRKLRERFSPSELPIVLLTAKTLVRDLIEGLDAGANDYLTKPFSSGELMARLRTHLHLSTINRAVSRFVPTDFLRLLERESIVDVRLGDSIERTMSVLFSDIRSFTSMSEQLSPRDNFRFINDYLGHMEPVVVRHHGFIDKFIGDAVMALFDRGADDAVQAGIGMLKEVDTYNAWRRGRGERAIRIGVGINSGHLMLGTVGGQGRMDGTVISDAVNLGSRLETLTKRYGVSMLVSEYTQAALVDPDRYRLRFVDRIAVRGRQAPVGIYEVFDGDPPDELVAKLETRPTFEAAVRAYHQSDYVDAHQRFLAVLHRNPTDLAAEHYVDRCRRRVRAGSGELTAD